MISSKAAFLKKLFLNFNDNQIDYFVIGEYEKLPYSTGSSDLDIIVAPEGIAKAVIVLQDLMVEFNVTIVSYYTNNNAFFYRFLCNENEIWGLQLDLFYKGFFYQTKEYFPVAVIKNDIILHEGIRVLDLKSTYFVGFLKEIVHKGWSKEKYIRGFINEIVSDELKYRELLEKLYGNEFVEIVFDNLTFSGIENNSKVLGNIMLKSLYHGSFSVIKNALVKAKYIKRIFKKPGYCIAFIGTDGSGKSTIIDAITPLLNQAFHNSVYYEHMRPNKLPSIARLLGKKEDFSAPVTDPHSQNPSGFVGSLFRFFYYYLDYTLGYMLKVFPKKAFKSCVWIFDRYYYDFLLDQKRARIKLPKFIIKVGAFFMPKPDMIICLGTDAEKIYARKPEISFTEVERQVSDLKAFCNQNKRAVWIDTGVDVETSKQACLEHITNFMTNRFKHLNK